VQKPTKVKTNTHMVNTTNLVLQNSQISLIRIIVRNCCTEP